MADDLVIDSTVQAQDAATTVESQTPNTSIDAQSTVSQQAAIQQPRTEKTFSRDEVARIVNAEKNKAIEREKARFSQESANVSGVNAEHLAGDVSNDRIRQLINEEAERMSNMAAAHKIAEEFTQKMIGGRGKHDDFDSVVAELDFASMPDIVRWANSSDNTAEIMYDIAKHPGKLANLLMLSQRAPHLAAKEMARLSDSIKKNEDATKTQLPGEPLSQIKSSPSGTDNGSMTVDDFRNQDWLR